MKYLFIFSTIFLFSCHNESNKTPDLNNLNWIDLTHSFDSTTLYWPNNKTTFIHHTDSEGFTPKGYFYSSYSICAPEHGGTHLDAPIHFAKDKYTVEELPLTSLTGNAVVIDVSKNALANRDYQISIEDITNWERENGKIENNTIILFKTGYGKFYPNRGEYFGTPKTGIEAIPELHFPGIDPKTTSWLIKERAIKAIGLDTPSLDFGQSTDFKTHQVLMGSNKPGFENLANLDKLPATKVYVVALPMKIGRGSGAPLRIIAGIAN
jgi:kynurenine formamidase